MTPGPAASHYGRVLKERNEMILAIAKFLGMSLAPGEEVRTSAAIRQAARNGTLLDLLRRRSGRREGILR